MPRCRAYPLTRDALEALMPLHVVLSLDGRIVAVGPLLRRLRPHARLTGRPFAEVFEVTRPAGLADAAALIAAMPNRMRLRLRDAPQTTFKGQCVPIAGGSVLINLSLGISLAEAVAEYRLTAKDFAPTDLTIEMLYLVEANAAAMTASRDLNARLQCAKLAAEEQAFTDTLTGLKNRRALDLVLRRTVETGVAFSLLHIDLDYFKAVNDTRGHAAGDLILRKVARHMVRLTREGDTVARVGGDEFVILLRDITGIPELNRISERLIARIEEPVMYEGQPCTISASIGIAVSTSYSMPTPEAMLRDSDAALYASKRRGRARYTVFTDTIGP